MTMSNTITKKKNHLSSPIVVSTECSSFKSFYLTCRRRFTHLKTLTNPFGAPQITSPDNVQSPNCLGDGRTAAQVYWRRIQQLEMELLKLDKWINIEKKLRDWIDDNSLMHSVRIERICKDSLQTNVTRLVDGSYLYEMKMIGGAWGQLAMQVSVPAIIPLETGSEVSQYTLSFMHQYKATVEQVLRRMASLGREKLRSWLLASMPINDIRCQFGEEGQSNPMYSGSRKGAMEDIISATMEKMEILVFDCLRLQMSAEENGENVWNKRRESSGESVIIVMLIQVRDPTNKYNAIGEFMIGFVEASVSDVKENGFCIEGVHVAGMFAAPEYNKHYSNDKPSSASNKKHSASRRENMSEANYLWSVSATECESRCTCCSWKCARNPDMMFY